MAYKRISPQPVVEGGTGAQTLTSNGVLLGNTTSAITATTAGTTGQILTGITGSAPTFQAPAASSISITGNSGGALTGNAFTFTGGTTGLTFSGAGTTETLTGTLIVANGGTGRATLTNHGLLVGAATTAITQLAVASTGQTLMGATGADPAFTGSPSFSGSVTAGTTITATSGAITATSGNVVITSGNLAITAATTSSVGQITQGGTRILHTMNGATNIFLGSGAGNFTLSGQFNTVMGQNSGTAITSGGQNTYLGWSAGLAATTASFNTAVGSAALAAVTTSGDRNTAIGDLALRNVVTGSNNTAVGDSAGSGLTTTDSNNIHINNNGTAGDNNACRIGAATGTGTQQLNKTFIAGIQTITVTGTAVLVSTADQLGVAVSSRKYKENIVDMAEDSSPVMELRPVTFTLKDHEDQSKQFGLIAEEVYEVMPELVVLDKLGKPQTVQYHNLPAILLNEIQKLQKRIEALEN